jgi:hypothetical protein
MPTLREKCISAKVSDDEYATLQALAGGQNLSAWARQVLLAGASPRLTEQVLLGELLALRAILLNLHFMIGTGEPITPDDMRRLIAQADQDKLRYARERFVAAAGEGD